MKRRTYLANGETYHIYNRGAHKERIFLEESDCSRFLALLFLSNTRERINLRDLMPKYKGPAFVKLFGNEKPDRSLVQVLAYSLVKNHFHLVLRQIAEDGITTYMQKVGTAYSMYFNQKYEHSGVLFQGRFGSSHLDTDPYFKWIFPYVHLNPISLVEPSWQEKRISNLAKSREFLRTYKYSSYSDYYVGERPERAILAYDEAVDLLDREADLHDMLAAYARGRILYAT